MKKICLIALLWLTALNAQTHHAPAPHWEKPEHSLFSRGLWSAMRHHFALNHHVARKDVQHYIHWWQAHPTALNETLEQAAPYLQYIYQRTQTRDLPAELALIPMVESHYQVFAYSGAGAVGLWQMMPGTATGQGLKINWWYDGRRDLLASTQAALNYLSYLHDYFDDWLEAIAAYDAGEGTLYHAIVHNQKRGLDTNFWSLALPRETHHYLPKLLALSAIIDDPENYGLKLPPIDNTPYFVKVPLPHQIDINQAARLAGISALELRCLNPGFKRWATDPMGPHALLIPVGHAVNFHEKLEQLSKQPTTPWYHHVVNEGETLGGIAMKYHTPLKALKQSNHLRSDLIRPGQSILVPGHTLPMAATGLIRQSTLTGSHVPGPRQVNYVVKKNDSLNAIAKAYHLKPTQITYWNQLKSKTLRAKQRLVLWIQPKFSGRSLTVQSGDSLAVIAKHHHTTVATLMRINRLNNSSIRIGQSLKLP